MMRRDSVGYDPWGCNKYYGKILGMSNAEYSAEEIARILSVDVCGVWDVIQRGYARSKMIRDKEY